MFDGEIPGPGPLPALAGSGAWPGAGRGTALQKEQNNNILPGRLFIQQVKEPPERRQHLREVVNMTPRSRKEVAVFTEREIAERIHTIRGQQVMLDRDLAELYGVKTKNLNKAVLRNARRFPPEFMFKLNFKEFSGLRFQNGTSKKGG